MLDRGLAVVALIAALVCIVVGIEIRRSDVEARRISRATSALSEATWGQRWLEREALNARLGLTRPPHDIGSPVAYTNAALNTLAAASTRRPKLERAVERLRAAICARYATVDLFKQDNERLQAALRRFTAQEEPPQRGSPSDRLPIEMLRLSISPTPAVLREAQVEIERVRRRVWSGRGSGSSDLLAEAERLLVLLPRVDGLLRSLQAQVVVPQIGQVRTVLAEETASVADGRRGLMIALTGSVLLLFLPLAALAARMGGRSRRARAAAANDRLDAAVAGALLGDNADGDTARLRRVLSLMAAHARAKRAFLRIAEPGRRETLIHHPADGAELPLRQAMVAAAAQRWDVGEVFISDASSDKSRQVLIRSGDDHVVVIGLEFEGGAATADPDRLVGVRLAMAIVAQAIRRRAAAFDVVAMERRLADAERLSTIGTVASGVAHSVNNLLGAIGGFGEMARGRVRSGTAAAAYLDEIGQSVARGRSLVEDILSYARAPATTRRPLRISRLTAEAARQLHASHDVAINVEDRTAGDVLVAGDAARLQQVLLNIGINAVLAAGVERPLRMTLEPRELPAGRAFSHGRLRAGDYVVLTLVDEGPGMTPEAAARAFDPFFTTRAGGTGLGLSTAWAVIQAHGGTIDLTLPGQGCRFEVWLPVAVPLPQVEGPASPRVLLLTAEEHVAAAEEALAELGFEPVSLGDGVEAGRLIEALAEVDAVLAIQPQTRWLDPWRPNAGGRVPPLVIAAEARLGVEDVDAEFVDGPTLGAEAAEALHRVLSVSRRRPDPARAERPVHDLAAAR